MGNYFPQQLFSNLDRHYIFMESIQSLLKKCFHNNVTIFIPTTWSELNKIHYLMLRKDLNV